MAGSISIHPYDPKYANALLEVFYTAIHSACTNEYSAEQRAAWAPKDIPQDFWQEKMRKLMPYVAVKGDKVVGYADVQKDGYIDHFFVHGVYQKQGVGAALMQALLMKEKPRYHSNVSDTAKGFFMHYGFTVLKRQRVLLSGVALNNSCMQRLKEQ